MHLGLLGIIDDLGCGQELHSGSALSGIHARSSAFAQLVDPVEEALHAGKWGDRSQGNGLLCNRPLLRVGRSDDRCDECDD